MILVKSQMPCLYLTNKNECVFLHDYYYLFPTYSSTIINHDCNSTSDYYDGIDIR